MNKNGTINTAQVALFQKARANPSALNFSCANRTKADSAEDPSPKKTHGGIDSKIIYLSVCFAESIRKDEDVLKDSGKTFPVWTWGEMRVKQAG